MSLRPPSWVVTMLTFQSKCSLLNRKSWNSHWYFLHLFCQVMKPQSLAQYVASSVDAEHEFEGERGGLTIKFWKKNRELAAVNFYIRKRGLASVEFLVNPQLYATGMQRSWSEGKKASHSPVHKPSNALSAKIFQNSPKFKTCHATAAYLTWNLQSEH